MSPTSGTGPPLSPLESEVMAIVWKRGEATAEQVLADLGQDLTNASVRTLLRRIEAKRFLTHRVEGRAFIYRPRVAEQEAARHAVRRLVDRFYGGSIERLVLGLLDGRLIDQRKLDALAKKVGKAR